MNLKDKNILLGVTGGIASYKAAELVRLLVGGGASVRVVMTTNAREFITPLTLQTLSGNRVSTSTFDLTQESEIGHIELADAADLVIIAPATANFIAKLAHGIADDLLSTILLVASAPKLIAPAMNVKMFEHPATQNNLRRLEEYQYHVLDPGVGELACGYSGKGRLPEPMQIIDSATALLSRKDLSGERIIVTAGPNCEPIDPIRFISNRSTGKMGYAMARAGQQRGARVTLIAGPTGLPTPSGVQAIPVRTAIEMERAVKAEYNEATMVISAAAIADYRPVEVAEHKLKKGSGDMSLSLCRNPDILAGLGKNKGSRILVGFATETENVLRNAEYKLKSKNLDLIVANDVTQKGAGFATDTNIVTLLDGLRKPTTLPLMSKDEVAHSVYDRLVFLRQSMQP